MRHGPVRSCLFALLTCALAIGPAGPSWGGDALPARAPGPAAAPERPGAPEATLTLVTGDRVLVVDAARGEVAVSPGAGRERIMFLTRRVAGHVYVLPSDVLAMVAADRLDQRLFDVTTLLRFGYDDARRDDVPLLVQYPKAAARSDTRARLSAGGARLGSDLPAARSYPVRQRKRDAGRFWSAVTTAAAGARGLAAGVERIWLDGKRELRLADSVPQVGAPAAWAAGHTGQGVTVAVLDSGVDAAHPDLAGRVAEERDFTGIGTAEDMTGHGTHVASIIVGSGTASGGTYRGMAPDARIVSGKVCPDLECMDSAVLAGMQWAAVEQRARVVNLSLGTADAPRIDPLEEAVNTLTAQQGTLFVVAAGNSGPGAGTVDSPASAEAALAVAAVTKADQPADFSSRGPRVGDGGIKPDIAAPGVDIVAARARYAWIGTPVGDRYLQESGTSMAAPHVAGAAALLASQHPDWGPGLLKAALMDAATVLPDADPFTTGTGRLDVARATRAAIVAEPGSLSLGVQRWPHDDDRPVTRTITYHNLTDSAATVTLAADLTGPYGDPPPAGMFVLDTTSLTVPGGGDGRLTVTVDTRGDLPFGRYTGRIRATVAGEVVAATPIAVEVEPQRYSLTLRHLGETGEPVADYFTEVIRTDIFDARVVAYQPGEVTLRLPKATYRLASMVNIDAHDGTPVSFLNHPRIVLDHDVTIDLDARRTRPLRFTVAHAEATPRLMNIGFEAYNAWGRYYWHTEIPPGYAINTGHLGPQVPVDEYVGRVEAALARRDADGNFATSPYRYNLAWYIPGGLPTGFNGAPRPRDLATVRESHRALAPNLIGERLVTMAPTVNDWIGSTFLFILDTYPLPAATTEYYTTRDVRWALDAFQEEDGWDRWHWLFQHHAEPVAYRAGSVQQERWFDAVFGPSALGHAVRRWGGTLQVSVPLFSDAGVGHVGWAGNYDTGRTVLYRDGEKVAEKNRPGFVTAEVPYATADYRVWTEAIRPIGGVSTRVTAAWTFESGYLSDDPTDVPIVAVRFSPVLDDAYTAPAGRRYTIPVRVEGATDGVTSLSVQVSYDDGGTWQQASLRRAGDGWRASVTHPAGAGHVALRARATDGRGKTVDQTIIRAYHIG